MKRGAVKGTGASTAKYLVTDLNSKTAHARRLRRIEGQVRGLQRMVEEDRYCGDILLQIGAVQQALRGVGRAVLKVHLRHYLAQAAQTGSREQAERIYGEFVNLIENA